MAPRCTPSTVFLALLLASCRHDAHPPTGADRGGAVAIDPARMARVGEVDARYQSYNVEMLEVTGGKFWRPYQEAAGCASRPRILS